MGISGGVNASMVNGMANDRFLLSPVVGVNYQLQFANILSFGVDVLYDQRGGKAEIFTGWPDNDRMEEYIPLRNRYLSVPIKFGLVSQGDVFGFGNIGVVPSYLISAHLDYTSAGFPHDSDLVEFTDEFSRLDIAFMLEGGGGIKVADKLHILATMGVQMGFVDIYDDPVSFYDEQPIEHHYGFTLSVGARYAFGGGGSAD